MNRDTVSQRKETLKKLLHVIALREDAIIKALYDDFRKPGFESVLTETHFVMSELRNTIRNIRKWSRTETVFPSLLNFPSVDHILKQPYGTVLVIAPWNYPFHLAMCPMIAAYAAGNSVIVKPSELTPNTSEVISNIVSEVFNPVDVEVCHGGAEVAEKLLERRWDYIFFTGSVSVGRKVARAAANNLTPVTLELGGKNPCIVSATADLKLAAKRIVWGKFLNAGQTCVAPDYILVESKVKTELLQHLKTEILSAYGENPLTSPDLARIVNEKNWQRLVDLITQEKVIHGGVWDRTELYLTPTIIDETDCASALMQEEIFGPILPVIGVEDESAIDAVISRFEKPLSLYVFTGDAGFGKRMITKYAFGGGCINDVVVQLANGRLPFGGVGNSGMGAYHGRFGFDSFTHRKSVTRKATWLDIPLRYAPYGNKIALLRKWLKWF